MKATGIVRRIDDLGRVVIPKEIRRTMRIREGDPLEIFTNRDGEVIFKKYSPIGELSEFAGDYADVLSRTTGRVVCVTDKDSVIAVAGAPKKELVDKKVSQEMENIMNSRCVYKGEEGNDVEIIEGETAYIVGVAVPIITEGDTVGTVAILGSEKDKVRSMGEIELKLASAAAGFIGKHMES
ncbi:MAG: stage V sporulation protein T [Clostridia bacterium]|nr:stage V sporulation protein T [Clostridia bacterium]